MTITRSVPLEPETAGRLLLIEDDLGLQRQMKWALTPDTLVVAGSREDALRLFKTDGSFEVVILDLGLPPDENGATEGMKALGEILAQAPHTKIIVASGHADRTSAVQAVGKQPSLRAVFPYAIITSLFLARGRQVLVSPSKLSKPCDTLGSPMKKD